MTLSDSRNKELALRRIKRLASSGLPLEPFVRSIFDLINDAVPSSANRAIHVSGGAADAYICSTPETNRMLGLHNQFFVESPPEVSGAAFRMNSETLLHVLPSRTIWLHNQIGGPNLYRAEGFNTVYRPLGWHHIIAVVYQEMSEYLGYYGIWRTTDQKAFSREDIAFLKVTAPHISHGLRVARLLENPPPASMDFVPLPGWRTGVILLDARGNPIAIDADARLIFQQLDVLNDRPVDALASGSVRDGFAYVSRTLAEIFRGTESDSEHALAPVYRIYHHWAGIVLKLRGVQMIASDGREYTTVLVERGETTDVRRTRVFSRWGLTQRETQILELIAQNKTGPESAILLGISHDTVRKHTSRVLEKLGVETRAAATSIVREAALVPAF